MKKKKKKKKKKLTLVLTKLAPWNDSAVYKDIQTSQREKERAVRSNHCQQMDNLLWDRSKPCCYFGQPDNGFISEKWPRIRQKLDKINSRLLRAEPRFLNWWTISRDLLFGGPEDALKPRHSTAELQYYCINCSVNSRADWLKRLMKKRKNFRTNQPIASPFIPVNLHLFINLIRLISMKLEPFLQPEKS